MRRPVSLNAQDIDVSTISRLGVHGGGNWRSLAGVAGWLALFLGIQVCLSTGGGMHLTSAAVQCRVLESLI